jgi:hypothetical protein
MGAFFSMSGMIRYLRHSESRQKRAGVDVEGVGAGERA